MIERTWMVHPDVEDSGRWMAKTAAPFHAAAGWVEADPPPKPEPEPKDKPGSSKPPAKKQTPRRPSTEGQD